MADDKVVGLRGEHIPQRKVNETCVEHLEDLLQKALSGEIIGVGVVTLSYDLHAGYSVGGTCGGYVMVGACEVLKADLLEVARGED